MQIYGYTATVVIECAEGTAPAKQTLEFGGKKSIKREDLATTVAIDLEQVLKITGGSAALDAKVKKLEADLAQYQSALDAAKGQLEKGKLEAYAKSTVHVPVPEDAKPAKKHKRYSDDS